MDWETIRYGVADGVATVTLDRPGRGNALNATMIRELHRVVDEVYERDDVRVLVVTGAGDTFSVGADYHELRFDEWAPGLRTGARRGIHRLFDELEYLEKPVIAAINGLCAGWGLQLTLSCDLRVAADSARLGLPEVTVGLLPGSGGCSRLVELVGVGRAKELAMLGGLVPAARAEAMNLVNLVVPAAELMARVGEVAATLMRNGPVAVGMAKHVINTARGIDPTTGRVLERLGSSVVLRTEDFREGVQAFVEGRPPRWTGR